MYQNSLVAHQTLFNNLMAICCVTQVSILQSSVRACMFIEKKQDSKCAYNVRLRRVLLTIVVKEKQ